MAVRRGALQMGMWRRVEMGKVRMRGITMQQQAVAAQVAAIHRKVRVEATAAAVPILHKQQRQGAAVVGMAYSWQHHQQEAAVEEEVKEEEEDGVHQKHQEQEELLRRP